MHSPVDSKTVLWHWQDTFFVMRRSSCGEAVWPTEDDMGIWSPGPAFLPSAGMHIKTNDNMTWPREGQLLESITDDGGLEPGCGVSAEFMQKYVDCPHGVGRLQSSGYSHSHEFVPDSFVRDSKRRSDFSLQAVDQPAAAHLCGNTATFPHEDLSLKYQGAMPDTSTGLTGVNIAFLQSFGSRPGSGGGYMNFGNFEMDNSLSSLSAKTPSRLADQARMIVEMEANRHKMMYSLCPSELSQYGRLPNHVSMGLGLGGIIVGKDEHCMLDTVPTQTKHNKYCHFCQHVKVSTALDLRGTASWYGQKSFCMGLVSIVSVGCMDNLLRSSPCGVSAGKVWG